MALVVVMLIVAMLPRIIKGPTAFDRFNGISAASTYTIISLVLYGYIAGRPDMYVDIAISYGLLSFISSVIVAKYLGGKTK